MRLAAYAGASVALATGVFLKALHQRANFYSACVYLSQSSANLMILTNLCLLITGFVLFWLQRLLYGPLRPIETEQIYERAWFAVTETCLAMTIFRGELGGWFLVMFISLLVGKVWGWIGEGRVEYLEQQPPANPRLFHLRLASSLILAVTFDLSMMRYCVKTVIHQAKPDMMVMFGFEFAILTILSLSTLARYGLALVEIYINHQQLRAKIEERRAEIRAARVEAIQASARAGEPSPPTDLPDENDVNELEIDIPGWEEKGRWVFYLDLLTDFVKLIVYLTFFIILLSFYGLPIHILRDVVVTIRSFFRRIMDFLRYRNATRDMNERYPDATPEEVGSEDVCIICREEMVSALPAQDTGANEQPAITARRVPDRLRPKKLPCGHILHFACLRSWLERQQNCPTCRRPVLVAAAAAARSNNAAVNGVGQQNGPDGNQAPGQPNGADGLPRARVFQFGPFRIGFGAVRGDLFQNLHQQIHQGNAPLQPAANANPQGARQIGLGFGFGGRPAPPAGAAAAAAAAPTPAPTAPTDTQPQQPGTSSRHSDIHSELRRIEQQISSEMHSLRIATEHYLHIRSLQAELDRIRLQQEPYIAQGNPSTESTTAAQRQQLFAPPGGIGAPPGWNLIPVQTASEGEAQGLAPTSTISEPQTAPQALATPSPPQVPVGTTSDHSQGTAHASGASAMPNPTTANAEPSIPSWGTLNVSSTDQRAESPSQEWTDVQAEQASEPGPSVIPSTWGSSVQGNNQAAGNVSSGTVDKGKGKAPTVEEADEET
ncbi:hypothetical protein N7470_001360 [Penicillium chermesinum]|nr:hypothetical protein N7470_001360 [Penicillium chermesinum]